MTKRILNYLLVGWGLIVILAYFFKFNPPTKSIITLRPSHEYYIKSIVDLISKADESISLNPIIYIMVFCVLIYFLYVIFSTHFGKSKLDFSISPAGIYIIFSFLFFLVFLAFVSFFSVKEINYWFFVKNYFVYSPTILLLFIVISSIGKLVLDLLCADLGKDELTTLLFSFGFGSFLLYLIFFVLGVFEQINQSAVLLVLILLALLSIKNIVFYIKIFITRFRTTTSYFSPGVFIVFVVSILFAYNMLFLVKPFPIGHDDLESYYNTTNLLANYGKLIVATNYPWELFVSGILAITRSLTLTLIFSSICNSLAALVIYKITKRYCERRNCNAQFYPLLMSALFFSLPVVVFQLTKDIKVDLPALFFSGLSLIAFWQWQDDDKHRKLFIAAFLAGFAFAIKLTLLFFGISLLVWLIIALVKKKLAFKKSLVLIILSFSLFLAPQFPFLLKHASELSHVPNNKISIGSFFYGYKEPIISLSKDEIKRQEKNLSIIKSLDENELARYRNNKAGLVKYLSLPFITTLNTGVFGQYIDIGFIFLILVPLAIYSLIFNHKKSNDFAIEVVIIGLIYWMLWAVFCEGVIWYGLPGFIFWLLLIVELLHKNSNNRFFRISALSIIGLWMILSFIYQTVEDSIQLNNIIYAGGIKTEHEYFHYDLPNFAYAVDVINQNIDEGKPTKVYLVSKYCKFFINHNNDHVYQDVSLNAYIAISEEKNEQEVADRFKKLGINYVVIDNVSYFGPKSSFIFHKKSQLIKMIRNNPDKFLIIQDNKEGNVFLAKIL